MDRLTDQTRDQEDKPDTEATFLKDYRFPFGIRVPDATGDIALPGQGNETGRACAKALSQSARRTGNAGPGPYPYTMR